jgi:hypothetical protein
MAWSSELTNLGYGGIAQHRHTAPLNSLACFILH